MYDANGNLHTDGTRGATIGYNLLNLPQTVTASGVSITYIYDYDGRKLRKISNGTATDYIDGIQYKSNGTVIDFIQTEEGRAINAGSSYNYEYTLTDHLGNNRVTFDQTNGKVGEDDYYPFGLNIHRQVNAGNNYLYNKKELQNELTEYDYGARFYDPVIGRWTSVDPKAELDRRWSPYSYGFSDPMRFTDPDGMWPDCTSCDILIGFAAAVIDNNTGGLLPVRQLAGHLVSNAKAFNRGQDAGDVASIAQGAGEVSGGQGTVTGAAVATVGSGGLAIEVTAPAAALGGLAIVHGAVVGGHGAYALASQKGRLQEPGSRPGKGFTQKGKKAVIDNNKAQNGGSTVCENCGVQTTPGQQSQSGVTPSGTETNVDHIDPKSNGGSGTPENGQVLCRGCNLKKGATPPQQQ